MCRYAEENGTKVFDGVEAKSIDFDSSEVESDEQPLQLIADRLVCAA